MKLNAVLFQLYRLTDWDEFRYIYSTFPIMERAESAAFYGEFRSRDTGLAYVNALAAGIPDVEVSL